MDGQLVIVAVILAVAVGYLFRSTVKTWTKPGCGSGCGKCATPEEPAGRRISLPRV